MTRQCRLFVIAAVWPLLAAGCAAPPATLDLISVAREAVAQAKADAKSRQAADSAQMQAQAAALDAAFDADVRLVAAGQLPDADGRPVELSAEWVISARKGYSAARALSEQNARSADAASRVALDNLDAADEALRMAADLVVANWNVSQRVKQYLMDAQRGLSGR
jgi:hypothetical protein